MGKINASRVILGGIVAGVVAGILGYCVDGVWLAPRWTADMKALGRSGFSMNQWIGFLVLGILVGIVAVWIYAAVRPRFGAGPRTAFRAAVATWILAWLVPNLAFMAIPHFFSGRLTLYTTLGALVETVVGTMAGAALYKEAAAAPAAAPIPGSTHQTAGA